MRRGIQSFYKTVFFLGILSGPLCAQPIQQQDQDFRYFRPSDFLNHMDSPYFPEREFINGKNFPQFEAVMNYLDREGIPIGIGVNANSQTIFELYLPLITRPEGQPAPLLGGSPEGEVGNEYFPLHDAHHHAVGIPGIRKQHFKDKAAARKLLIEVMLLKEQVATVHSLLDYIRIYWNWRDTVRHGYSRPDFAALNQGIYPYGKMSRETAVDMIGDFVHGRPIQYAQKLWSHFDIKTAIEARKVGVPIPGPPMHQVLGPMGEALVSKLILPIIEPWNAYVRDVGYKGFYRYADAMADFMLQDWYVEWADRFQIGIPLEALKTRAEEMLDRLRKGEAIVDNQKASPHEFSLKFLNHQVSLFGRRVAEIRELGRRGQSREDFSAADAAKLTEIFNEAAALSDNLRSTDTAHIQETTVQAARLQYESLIATAEEYFPPETYIPTEWRQPFIVYDRYWRDMTALALPRYGHNSNGFSPGAIKEINTDLRKANESWRGWFKMKWLHFKYRTLQQSRELWDFQLRMAEDYDIEKKKAEAFVATNIDKTKPVYLQKLEELKQVIDFQINKVVLPQVLEALSLEPETRKDLIQALKAFSLKAARGVSLLEAEYSRTYQSGPTANQSSSKMRASERRFSHHLDEGYREIYKLLDNLESKISGKKIKEAISNIREISTALGDPMIAYKGHRLKYDLDHYFPIPKWRVFSIPPILRDAHFKGRDIVEGARAIWPSRFIRQGPSTPQYAMGIRGWNPQNAPSGDANFVLTMNHDQGLLDVSMGVDLLQKLNVDKIFFLVTQEALPKFKSASFNDDRIVFIEINEPVDVLVERVLASSSQRNGVLIFPEGFLASFLTDRPASVKPGAFVMARRLAHADPARPTYLVNSIYNGFEHFTDDQGSFLNLEVSEPILVPKTEVSKNDPWVNDQRLAYENDLNSRRLKAQVNLIDRRRASKTNLPASGPVKAYVPYSQWFGNSALLRCSRTLQSLVLNQARTSR